MASKCCFEHICNGSSRENGPLYAMCLRVEVILRKGYTKIKGGDTSAALWFGLYDSSKKT